MGMIVYESDIDVDVLPVGAEIKICPVRHTYILAYNSLLAHVNFFSVIFFSSLVGENYGK